jgi:ribosomal silencing factor RsfS
MQAMLFKIDKMALERFGKEMPHSKQTSQGKDWECMDFGEVVVQVMTTESRDFYDLEGFYAQAEEVRRPFAMTAEGSSAALHRTRELYG